MMDTYISEQIQPIGVGKSSIKPEIDPVTPLLQITPGKFKTKVIKVLEAAQVHSLTKTIHLVLGPRSSP